MPNGRRPEPARSRARSGGVSWTAHRRYGLARLGMRQGWLLDEAPARHGGGPDPDHAFTDDFSVNASGLRSRHMQETDAEAEQDTGEHDIDKAHGIPRP